MQGNYSMIFCKMNILDKKLIFFLGLINITWRRYITLIGMISGSLHSTVIRMYILEDIYIGVARKAVTK